MYSNVYSGITKIIIKIVKISVCFVVIAAILFSNGCGRNSVPATTKTSQIICKIKKNITDYPSPQISFINQTLYDKLPNEFIDITKKYYKEVFLLKNIIDKSSAKKTSFLGGQFDTFEKECKPIKKYYDEKDWLNAYTALFHALIDAEYLLPYAIPDDKMDELFEKTKKQYANLLYEEKQLTNELIDIENRLNISEESWLNLSYAESLIYDIHSSFLDKNQIEELFTEYTNSKYSRSYHGFPKDVYEARILGSALSDIKYAENDIYICRIVIKTMEPGKFTHKEVEQLLKNYKDIINTKVVNTDKNSWGSRLLLFAKGNYDDGIKYENKGFFSLALLQFQIADIFTELAGDWAHYPDTIHYFNPKKNPSPPPLEKLLSYRRESVLELNFIEKKLDHLEKQGKICLNIRYIVGMYYGAWFKVGDSFLKVFIDRKGNWADVGNIAYLNIGPVPHALKIIEEMEERTCERKTDCTDSKAFRKHEKK